ncbi:MAG: large repetitive protein [Thermoanaerobaculia bacterium]|nr:large repetitive protein [Thermoanaerobaculia bacterium]
MSRVTYRVVLILAMAIPRLLEAQSCTPPVIIQVGGTNPVCAGQPVMLDAGPGWTTYQWSPGGATTRMISDTPAATMSYTVRTTDANGCSVTSQPLTVAVSDVPTAPSIQTRETNLCEGAQGEATVSGSWSSYQWSVTNGAIVGGANSATVDYSPSGAGSMTLAVTVTDSNGCAVTANASVSLRTIQKPAVQTYPAAICAGSYGSASINPPAEGAWQSYHWTITNGIIAPWSGDSSSYVSFNSDAAGQAVVVQVTATDSYGCTSISDAITIPVRTISKPVIQTYPAAICAGSYGSASINPPAEGSWQSYHWTITNGIIAPWSGDSSSYVSFNSDAGGQPVVVQVTATDSYGCTSTSDPITIPVRTIPKPTVQTYPAAICAGSYGSASINPPAEGSWQSYHWTVTNGTIASWSGDSSSYVSFNSDAGGQPVVVQVTATDSYGCTESSVPITIPVRTISKPTVQTYPAALCAGSYGSAQINAPAEGGSWQSYHWTVLHGTIASWSGDSSPYVTFNSDAGGQPVVVQVTATDSYGCTETSVPITIPVRTISKPTVQTSPEAICPGSNGSAQINAPAEGGSWQSYHWTVLHGTIASGSGDSSQYVTFTSDPGGQPVTVQVAATDSYGCTATSDPVTIPVRVIGPPPIIVDTPPTCAGSSAQVSLAPPSDPSVTWQNIQWTVTGGAILDGATSSVMHLQTDPAGGTAVVTVSAQTSQGCSGTSSTTLTTTAVTPSLSTGPTSICAGGSAEADLNDNWSLFQSFHWTVTHATINGISTNPYVQFTADGTGDVTATLTTVTMSGCTGTASVTYRLGGPDATITAPASDSFCVNSQITASVPDAGSGATYEWTINGSQAYGAGRTLTFNPSTTSFQLGVTVSLNGCSSSGSKNLTALAAPQATLSAPSRICYLSTGNTVTLSDPGPGVTIEWPANTASLRVTPTADPLVAHFDSVPYQYFNGRGAIVAKLTNASGCVSYVVASVVVDVPSASASPAGPTTFCQGGSVMIYGNPTGTGYSYLWSNGATTANINATESGSYTVIVTDPAGCSLSSSAVNVTVNTPATPTITANGPTTFCGTGSVTLASSPGASYSWSNGATTQAITVSTSGSYTVTVTDANGCSATSAPTVVSGYPAMQKPDIIAFGPTAFCQGGSVNLSASAVNPVSYLWSNGATTFTINATAAGSYTCTVTDANGCSATSDPKVVTVYPLPPNPTVTAAGPTTFCQGGSVTLHAPAGYATYVWFPTGEGTPSITVTQTGTYSVDLKDANGCWASSGTAGAVHVTVLNVPTPEITAGGPTTFCAGGSVTLTAPSGYTYSWSTGATTQSITATTSGAYTVTITGTNGCSATSAATNVTVNAKPPTPVVTASGPTSFCAPGSVTLTAPSGYTYSWSNGATTQSINVNTSDSFTVTVTNASGCTATSTPTVVTSNPIPAKPTVTVGGPTTFCAGGSVTLTAPSGYTYSWSNGMNTQSISVSLTGNYYVAVYDANGCGAASDPVSVTVNQRPVATIDFSAPNAFCDGGQPIVLTSSLAASYLWSTGQTTRSVSFNQAGSYNVTVTVTDANGCSATSQPRLFRINALPPTTITANGPTTFCTPGSVRLTAPIPQSQMFDPNTDGPYTYLWSTGATTSSITATQSGSYSVTVTNYYGCSATSAPTVVTANPTPSATITPSGPTSFCAPGSVTLSAPAGAGYSYQWTNGATTQSISATTTGSYNVTVISAAGCSATGSPVFVNADTGPPATITPSGPTSFCAGIGSVTLNALPIGGSLQYLWSTGATTSSINVTTSGSYSVTITDGLGCSTTSAPTVVTANAPPPQPVISASGPTTFCAGGSVTLTAPAGYTYFWGTGDHTQSIVVTNTGGYQVTVRDANGCQSTSAVVNVTVNPLPATPAITAGGPTTFCAGGSVTLTAPGGYTYSWSNGATTQAINATTGASYSVTITNANGCSATSAATVVTVNAPPATPAITASGPTTFCAGGSVTLTAPSGYTYLWTGGWTTQSISVGSSGSYSVTVRDANGCSSTSAPTVVTAMAALPTPTINVTPSPMICEGTTATLTAPAGYSYLWSNGATTQSITSSTSSSFTVTVTDANGCSATSYTAYVTVYPVPPVPTLTASGPTTFCSGGSVTLTAPTGYTNYIWSEGTTTWVNGSGSPANAITVSSPGNYTVQVRGDNFCYSTSAPMVVTVNSRPPTPAITAGGPTTFCAGGSVTLTASLGTSYLWSTGATTGSIIASASGNYSVTVTNASGCSATSSPATVTVNANPTASITAGGPTTFCAGGSVTLTASSASSYLWSTGATTQSITANTTGNYSVSVTNASGCSATSSPTTVTVNANPTASITAGGPTTFCAGGSVTLTASSGASYLWSTGATTQSIVASASGNYSVTVTNASGCSATSSPTTVTVNANPTATITAGGPTTFCAGGSVTLTASSGASYLWSTGATTQSIVASASGNYSVTVTNASGCSATSSPATVTVNANPTASISAGGPTTFCAGGSVTLTASSASSYLWSNGATTQSIVANASGNYSVTVMNANGCSASSAPTVITVNANPTATITPSGPTTFCAGGNVTLTASSGASYLWSTGATTQSIVASASGNFSVTVTNANGCSATSSPTTVTVNANPTASISAGGPTTFCAGGSVTLTASSGASYLWSNGATTQSIVASASGNYSVTVMNANGCSATSAPTAVTANANPTATITASGPTSFCAGGSVTLTASSGASCLWSTGATTQSIVASASGNYSVTVTNANGCSATSSPTTVTVNANPTASITAGGPTTFCPGGSVTLTASSGASYLWSTGATTQSIIANASGNYSVTATNASGCSATSAATAVTVNANPTVTITAGGPTTFCAGGSVTLTASSGASYLWSTGATTQSIVVSANGNYSVTVTNASGCSTGAAPIAVTVRAKPTASVSGTSSICPSGSATITAALTGTAPWSVTWSDNVTQTVNTGTTATRSVSPSATTTYSVTAVSDATCSGTASGNAVVTVKTLPAATVSGGGAICPGGSATITATLTGTAPWSVTWSDNVTQTVNSGTVATRSVSPAATTTYTVTSVSDAASCPRSGTGSATVTANVAASITTQPTNQTTTRNVNLTLTVVAAGTAPISYQWFNGSGTSIAGATSASYTTSFTKKGTNTFYVEVWNACNTTHVKSNTVTVTVN